MTMQHISELSANDFQALIGQTFQVPAAEGVTHWVLRRVETQALLLASEPRTCGEGETLPPKMEISEEARTRLAKAAVDEMNVHLDALGYKGPRPEKSVSTTMLSFEGDGEPPHEADYHLFNETLGSIEGARVIRVVDSAEDSSAAWQCDVMYQQY